MAAKPPTNLPEAPAAKAVSEKPVPEKFDRFRPEMPAIPGVSNATRPAGSGFGAFDSRLLLGIGGIVAAVVLLGMAIIWHANSKERATVSAATESAAAEEQAPAPSAANLPTLAVPGVAATVDELDKPWAFKKFTFFKPLTQENIDAMVIRLPSGGFWAFSLQVPYSRCELEFVTDTATIASTYRYKASHPMIVSPCDGTIYDPLKIGPLGGNTWARGEIVQGSSLRPPISIDVKVQGHSIIADSIE